MPRSPMRPHAKMTVQALANLSLLDTLNGAQLVVYLRLIAATGEQSTRRVAIRNADLYRNPRTAVAALRQLEGMGLITIHYDGKSDLGRTIEVTK